VYWPNVSGPVTFGGDGLQPDVAQEDWDAVRDRIYEGRGAFRRAS
jgi:hypothetical protein